MNSSTTRLAPTMISKEKNGEIEGSHAFSRGFKENPTWWDSALTEFEALPSVKLYEGVVPSELGADLSNLNFDMFACCARGCTKTHGADRYAHFLLGLCCPLSRQS